MTGYFQGDLIPKMWDVGGFHVAAAPTNPVLNRQDPADLSRTFPFKTILRNAYVLLARILFIFISAI